MAPLPHNEIIRALVERGLIAAQPAPRPLPRGNLDRRAGDDRTSWRAQRPDGSVVKLTLGTGLADLAGRHTAMARACREVVAPLLFFETTPHGDALAESFFEGVSIDAALAAGTPPPTILLSGLNRIEAALAATLQPSDEFARQTEWRTWADGVLSLDVWQETERVALREKILPQLYTLLSAHPPATRWSNGDFTPGNVLIDEQGSVRLIDMEFATRTHFFPEDAVRFPAFSPPARALLVPALPCVAPPPLGWHLFFWLRQFHLEATQNTPAYVERVRARRLGLIRLFAEQVLECPVPGWSQPPIEIVRHFEHIRWAPDQTATLRLHGWIRWQDVRLETVAAFSDSRRIAEASLTNRDDVARYFGADDARAGFQLAVPLTEGAARIILAATTAEGELVPFHSFATASIPGRTLQFENYSSWAALYDPDPAARITTSGRAPQLLSVLLPVYNPPAEVLRACLESMLSQHHAHWELVVVDDASDAPHVPAILEEFARRDQRINLHRLPVNGGIARATNAALTAARGDFIVLLDHDDLLRPHALMELASRLDNEPELDVLYSDEDKITVEGRPVLPFFKPAFSPEFLLGVMYIGHVLCVRTTVAREAGGFRPEYDGVQDYEFFLRVTERTRRIGHVPRVLYHWRQSSTSSALLGNVKGDMDAKQLAAVRSHLARIGDPREATSRGGHRVKISAGAGGPTHEVFAMDANHVPAEAKVVRLPGGLSPTEALRQSCAQSSAEIVVLLHASMLAASPDWARELAAIAAKPDSGCVAPVLLAADGRVWSAGWTAGPAGSAPVLRGFHPDDDGYNGSLACNREVSAISPHCLAVRRELAQRILGELAPGATWLDFCARMQGEGKYHRTCAHARLRLNDDTTTPLEGALARPDPFFNPHFDPQAADYSLATTQRPAPKQSLQFHLDQPAIWDSLPRCLILRGWAFSPNSVQMVRLQTGALVFAGVVGLPRPDVQAALPGVTEANTGFEIRAVLPAGQIEFAVEIQLSDQRWQPLLRRVSRVPRRWRPLWLGGGDWTELMFFQMPGHMAYPARPISLEKFPAAGAQPSRPRLAIVTPSYNQARFVSATLRSVLEQPGVTCDYVVQDGGSSDGSQELIGEYGRRLHAWASERDAGQADAIAKGFAKTSGQPEDVMAWINSDDFYLPGALAFVADYFARHPDVDVLYGHRVVVNEESKEIARWFLPRHDPDVLRLNDFVPQETMFWRRRIWDRVGGIDPSFKFAMDWDLLLRFQAAGAKIVRVPYFLACFRVHAAQKTSAAMHSTGQQEITLLRERAHGRSFPPQELEQNPRLLRYLRRSAFIEFLWKLGIRVP